MTPYTVEYVPGNQSFLAHIAGVTSWDQYQVIDPEGNIIATCLTASEANEWCWRYNCQAELRKASE